MNRRHFATPRAGGVRCAVLIALGAALAAVPAMGRADSVTLSWTATGDDGSSGRASSYELRYSDQPVVGGDTTGWWSGASTAGVLPAPATAGTRETYTMSGLTTGTIRYFVLRVADEVPNWSTYSNVRQRTAGDTLVIPTPETVTNIHGFPNPARNRVTLRFPGGDKEGAPARVRVAIYDLTGHLVSRLLDAVYPAGDQTAEWLCRSDAGSPVAPGLYNVILDGPKGRMITRIAVVP
jgi:hypothetical protein